MAGSAGKIALVAGASRGIGKAMAKCPLAFQPDEGWTYAHASHDIIGNQSESHSDNEPAKASS